MKFDGNTLSPWADFLRTMQNARTLTVKVAGKSYTSFDLSSDDEGGVVMDFGGEKKVKKHG